MIRDETVPGRNGGDETVGAKRQEPNVRIPSETPICKFCDTLKRSWQINIFLTLALAEITKI